MRRLAPLVLLAALLAALALGALLAPVQPPAQAQGPTPTTRPITPTTRPATPTPAPATTPAAYLPAILTEAP